MFLSVSVFHFENRRMRTRWTGHVFGQMFLPLFLVVFIWFPKIILVQLEHRWDELRYILGPHEMCEGKFRRSRMIRKTCAEHCVQFHYNRLLFSQVCAAYACMIDAQQRIISVFCRWNVWNRYRSMRNVLLCVVHESFRWNSISLAPISLWCANRNRLSSSRYFCNEKRVKYSFEFVSLLRNIKGSKVPHHEFFAWRIFIGRPFHFCHFSLTHCNTYTNNPTRYLLFIEWKCNGTIYHTQCAGYCHSD